MPKGPVTDRGTTTEIVTGTGTATETGTGIGTESVSGTSIVMTVIGMTNVETAIEMTGTDEMVDETTDVHALVLGNAERDRGSHRLPKNRRTKSPRMRCHP